MKPINLERVLAGDPVITKSGEEVTQLTLFESNDEYPLVGVVDGNLEQWTKDGKYHIDQSHTKDLCMAPKKVTYWVNVYNFADGRHAIDCLWDSEKDAQENINPKFNFQETISVTIEE